MIRKNPSSSVLIRGPNTLRRNKSFHEFQPVLHQSVGIGTREPVDRLHPMPLVQLVPGRQDGKNRHHALQRPDADVLPVGHDEFGIFDEKVIPNVHGQVAVSVYAFNAHFDLCHAIFLL